jgi:DNA polymerase (family 10)
MTRARLSSLNTQASGLIRQCDVLGLLHCHSIYHDGAHSLREMVTTARDIGLDYLGFSDHVRSGAHPGGLEPDALDAQREEIEDLRLEFDGFDILHGVEVVLEPDGSLALEDRLHDFDFVIVSLGPCDGLSFKEQTERAIRAIMHPCTTILSKPIGEYMFTAPPLPMDMPRILRAAAEARIAVEVNAVPPGIDERWIHCRLAQEYGVLLSINPDAHRAARLVDYRFGVELARKAGLCCRQMLNTMTAAELRAFFKRDH